MKDHSPLVPQGSFEAQARGKSRVKLAFYTIVIIHVLAIAGFLIIGCKREDKEMAANTATPTNDTVTPPFGSEPSIIAPAVTNTNPPTLPGATSGVALTPGAPGTAAPPIIPTPLPTNPPSVPPVPTGITETTPATEHTIVKGDTFATIATKYGVSVRAIQSANPGVDPTRLKIGQKIKVPPKSATARNGTAAGIGTTSTDSGDTYTVKSGDTLSKIAKDYHTTPRELQKLNNLSTTQIRVGQKLKVPARAAVSPAGAASGGTAVPSSGTPPPPAQ